MTTRSGRRPEPGPPGGPVGPLSVAVRGSGPDVVLLHGQPGSARHWSAVVPLLVGACRVLAIDRPGNGTSPGPAGGFATNSDAVVATLDRLEVDRAVMVGHSWGGGVALDLATRFPERTAGLVLVSSIGPGAGPSMMDRLLGSPYLGEALLASSFAVTRTVLTSRRFRRGLDRFLPEAQRAAVGIVAGGIDTARAARVGDPAWRSFFVEQQAFNAGLEPISGRLAAIDTPTEVLAGTADHVVPATVGARLARTIPGAVLREVDGGGHLLPFDHPGEIAEAVRRVALATPAIEPEPSSPS